MRLWHPKLLCAVDVKRLVAQHREVHGLHTIAIESRPAYRNHPLVKEFLNSPKWLSAYHELVVTEMLSRKYGHSSPLIWHTPLGDAQVIPPIIVEPIYPPPGNPYTKEMALVIPILGPNVPPDWLANWKYNFWFLEDCKRLDEKRAWLSEEARNTVIAGAKS